MIYEVIDFQYAALKTATIAQDALFQCFHRYWFCFFALLMQKFYFPCTKITNFFREIDLCTVSFSREKKDGIEWHSGFQPLMAIAVLRLLNDRAQKVLSFFCY